MDGSRISVSLGRSARLVVSDALHKSVRGDHRTLAVRRHIRATPTRTRAWAIVIWSVVGCGDESGSGAGAGGAAGTGGTPLQDIPCSLEQGCVIAELDLTFQCTAPDDGSGVTEW